MSQTVQLSDTIDQYQRKLHVNTRNGKVTMMLRWKDRASDKAHTQRVTFEPETLGQTIGLLCVAGEATTKGDTIADAIGKVVENNPFAPV